MLKSILITMALTMTATAASAAPDLTVENVTQARNIVRLYYGDDPSMKTTLKGDLQTAYLSMQYVQYTYKGDKAVDLLFCVPADVALSPDELAGILRDGMKRHAQWEDIDLRAVLLFSLTETYPCKE